MARQRRDDEPLRPEVVDPVVEQVAWLMDRSIPIGGWKIGLDPILGLIPGAGDLIGTLVSGIIVWRAFQVGLPKSAIARMVVTIAIDAAVGAIPFAGDLFDFVYNANVKNLQIFRESSAGRREPAKDWAFVATIALLFLAILAIPILIVIWVIGQASKHLPAWL